MKIKLWLVQKNVYLDSRERHVQAAINAPW